MNCPGCAGDGEITPGLAWCIECQGTGLADHHCEGCGQPTSLDTVDRTALECIETVVHATCDTGNAYFDNRPAPKLWIVDPHCQFPVEDGEPCPRAAVWTTGDLGDVRLLCAPHCTEALILNDFIVDPVSP